MSVRTILSPGWSRWPPQPWASRFRPVPLAEFAAAAGRDTPVHEDVDVMRGDVVEQPLVVGDDQEAPLGRGELVDAFGHVRRASMSRPESVSSITARRGSRTAICRTSLRLRSPPENPSLR
jgi:hypothetical protein